MLISLGGIICMQLLWLVNVSEFKREQFDYKVNKALYQIVSDIENLESLIISHNIVITDTIVDKENFDTLFTYNYNLINDIKNDPFYKERIIKRKEQINKMLSHIYWELQSDKIYVFRKKLYNQLDSIIKNALYVYQINLPFEYAVFKAGIDTPEFATKGYDVNLSNQIYRVILFPNSILPSSETLVLIFKGQKMHILQSMLIMIIGSTLFTLIFIIVIIFSIKTIIKQKKIAEIKSDFINNMTHEFKTPIATISLASDAIISDKTSNDIALIKYYASIIKEENRRMNMHVENILQMSMLDKNEIELNLTPQNIILPLKKVVDIFKLHVAEKNGTLDLTIGNNNDIIVLIDETHFCNLISNLLDNAIKYSQGPPEISVKVEIKKNEVLISVADKGIGISKDAQKYIFEKFFREHTGYVHNVKGFGLGLAYARTVTEAFKGKIDVKSKSGMGSIFTVRLPLYN